MNETFKKIKSFEHPMQPQLIDKNNKHPILTSNIFSTPKVIFFCDDGQASLIGPTNNNIHHITRTPLN
jgi:hypothetical protein